MGNTGLRLGIATPIAAIITLALLLFMAALIAQVFEEPDGKEQRILEAITPQQETQEIRRTSRSRPQRLASADKPPPPPKLSSSKSDIDLPTPNIQGAAPTELNFDRVQSIAIDPVAISDRDAQPI
ncbi:MAG: energy transducer TonB, partial [Pseudomonadota bacterium]